MSDNESEHIIETGLQGNSLNENDFRSAMLKMMSDLKTDFLANVQESVAQVYHDFGYNEDANSGDEGIRREQMLLAKLHISLKNPTRLVNYQFQRGDVF